jgi:hypothetical protein
MGVAGEKGGEWGSSVQFLDLDVPPTQLAGFAFDRPVDLQADESFRRGVLLVVVDVV